MFLQHSDPAWAIALDHQALVGLGVAVDLTGDAHGIDDAQQFVSDCDMATACEPGCAKCTVAVICIL